MGIKCSAGPCGISCDTDGCSCTSSWSNPDDCSCECIQSVLARNRSSKVQQVPIVRFKRRIRTYPQSRYNVCYHNVPITILAQSYDKIFPNRILVPANKLTKKVTLSLKGKTFKQIVISSGLALKK
jgi:hypothetical protein